MRSKLPAALLLPVLVLLLAAPVSAQRRHDPRRPQNQQAHVQQSSPLLLAIDRVHQRASAELGHGSFVHQLEQLRRTAERLEARAERRRHRRRPAPRARLQERHRSARRALFSAPRAPSDTLLDAWDEVTVAVHGAGTRIQDPGHRPPHRPPPRPYEPPPPAPLLSFDGAFENMPVRFAGASPAAVHQACEQWASRARLQRVDDVTIGNHRHHLSSGYFSAAQLCGLVALNARAPARPGDVTIEGLVERAVAFHLTGAAHDIRATLRTYLPIAVANLRVDDVTIGGRRFHQNQGYWSGAQLAELVAGNLDPGQGGGTGGRQLVARGRIEQTPFVLVGQDAAELQRACGDFMRSVVTENVDDVTVNGRHRHNGPGYWNEAEVCMIITSMAQGG